MSYADTIFRKNITDILDNGTSTEGELVRPHWSDGTSAYTIKQFGICNTYDLRKEFPAMTFRKTALKSCMDEILWIYQRKSNNIHDLNSHIWDEWADESGSIGKAYGYQVAKKHPTKYGEMDQMDFVLESLKKEPFGRRAIISLWDPEDLMDMRLQPCCWSINFCVTDDIVEIKDGNKKTERTLNLILNQRSADMLTANNWNVCQYAILLMMVAQSVDMVPGKLVHMITDAHIYDRHVDLVRKLLDRRMFVAPKVSLNPKVKDFYKFTTDDLIVENYLYGEQIFIPVAI